MGIVFIAYDIMKYDLEKLTTYTHWEIWHKLQTVQSELILLFSFQWLLILSSVNTDHKLCLFQKRFYINPEEQIKHPKKACVIPLWVIMDVSIVWPSNEKLSMGGKISLTYLCIYWLYSAYVGPIVLLICPIKSLFLPEVWLPKFIVISCFWALWHGCLK